MLSVWLAAGCASTETPIDEETVQETAETENTPAATAIDRTKVTEAKNSADSARFEAENAKAPKAAKEEYEAAAALYEKGVQLEEEENLEDAYEAYTAAESGFKKAVETAEMRKQEALKAMNEADTAISSVEKNAQDAAREAEQEEN